ncbi:zinc-dependent peptidase [Nitrosomonas halophila]|uniref:Zinc-dependent peptidase n=1 Tax=Nitrosomonas halophila TaxID=44576 RepID=A0A1H3NNL4_9PROT|nr:M90 family metallopeptidase [Nitrosomonas halophila]SDY90414.1 hypothetical protein SAMN05421881_10775 [Nitrosomonas halophila]
MIFPLKNWRRRYILKRESIPDAVWQDVLARLYFLRGLGVEEITQLRQLAVLFLHDKKITGAQDFIITEEMRVMIAVQACLLILKLDLDYYDNWVEVILYPGQFILNHEYADENGIVHRINMVASGESWLAGPVILSWEDVRNVHNTRGYNVVIHEFAHKLDMLTGAANGFPVLHGSMNRHAWSAIFSQAYEDFCERVERGREKVVDPYAAESPAEFFAVLSEAFFVRPQQLKRYLPAVYQQLAAFYRQDPAMRWVTSTSMEGLASSETQA